MGITTSFRKPFTVMRAGTGAFVNGIWTPQSEAAVTIQATIQPAILTDYDRIQSAFAGERLGRVIRIYTSEVLNVADPRANANGAGVVADVIIYQLAPDVGSGRFRVIDVSTWQSGVLPHYRYLAVAEPEPDGSVGTYVPPPVTVSGGGTPTTTTTAVDTFIFNQNTPSATWSIAHNLGSFPTVAVVDSTGNEVEADVRYISNYEITITFAAACSGTAYLN